MVCLRHFGLIWWPLIWWIPWRTSKTREFICTEEQWWPSTLTPLLRKAPWAKERCPTPLTSRTPRSYWAAGPRSPRARATSRNPTPSRSTSAAACALWMRTKMGTGHRSSPAPWGSWRPHPSRRPAWASVRCPPRFPRARSRPVTCGWLCWRASAPRRRSTSTRCGTPVWWVFRMLRDDSDIGGEIASFMRF